MPLFRVTYDRWFRDRDENWDFADDEEFVHATSAQHAVSMVTAGSRRISNCVAVLATEADRQRYLADVLD